MQNEDISFCIQGQIALSKVGENQTKKLIESIEHFFPGAPIYFATWENQDLSEFKDLSVIIKTLIDGTAEGLVSILTCPIV